MASVGGYTRVMRAIFLEVPEHFLAERRRLGHDKKDEVWEGVLHMVPPPSGAHETVTWKLAFALKSIADRLGLEIRGGTTGLFDPIAGDRNYRIPDVVLVRPDQMSARGLEGAELVVEVLSPYDESRDKFPFYARIGVREVWLIEPITRTIELYSLRGQTFVRQLPEPTVVTSPVLGVTLEVVDGPRLRVHDGTVSVDV